MGNLYVNFTVRSTDPRAVATALRGRSALVTPARAGCVVVVDEEADTQDNEAIRSLCRALSLQLPVAVLAVLNHDDDILRCWLANGGRIVDEHDSWPG